MVMHTAPQVLTKHGVLLPESKGATYRRLRSRGQWAEACHFREQKRQQLKAQGHGRTAADLAWLAMVQHYWPQMSLVDEQTEQKYRELNRLTKKRKRDSRYQRKRRKKQRVQQERQRKKMEESQPKPIEMLDDETVALLAERSDDFVQDVQWVAESIYVSVEAKDAPSLTAWSILQWARSDDKARQSFFTSLLPKVHIASKDKPKEDDPYENDPTLEDDLGPMLAEIAKRAKAKVAAMREAAMEEVMKEEAMKEAADE